jgi:dTDP-4-dehydrorhamnose 3,5-epimerase
MELIPLSIEGLFVLEAPVWPDDRGFFREWFSAEALQVVGAGYEITQANFSHSEQNVIRGLHYSIAPEGQAKIVNCVYGNVLDVVVDIREGSPTYGVVELIPLSGDKGAVTVLPTGVAHGFSVQSQSAGVAYLLSSPYSPTFELGIKPLDPEIGVEWALLGEAILSEKDRGAPTLAQRAAAGQLPAYTSPR